MSGIYVLNPPGGASLVSDRGTTQKDEQHFINLACTTEQIFWHHTCKENTLGITPTCFIAQHYIQPLCMLMGQCSQSPDKHVQLHVWAFPVVGISMCLLL